MPASGSTESAPDLRSAVPWRAASNTAEISTGNLRNGGAFDNIKASWNQALKLGDFSTNLKANYDYNANRDFLKDVEFSGDLVEGSGDDVSVSYEVTHDFADKNTNVKLTAVSAGTTVGAEYDQNDGVKEVTAERDVDFGDQKVGVEAGWVVKAKAARVAQHTRDIAEFLSDADLQSLGRAAHAPSVVSARNTET